MNNNKSKKVSIVLLSLFTLYALSMFVYSKEYNNDRRNYIDNKLEPLIENTENNSIYKFDPIVQLYRKGTFICSGSVIGQNYIVTAAHCLTDIGFFGRKKTNDVINIRIRNVDTEINGHAAGVNFVSDMGLISGDFSAFNSLRLENEFTIPNQALVACGYPWGNKEVSCNPFKPITNEYFLVRGLGNLVPGMSGGPVLYLTNTEIAPGKVISQLIIVGINSSVSKDNGVGVIPTQGLLGTFGIEPL